VRQRGQLRLVLRLVYLSVGDELLGLIVWDSESTR
jgi:hypothetical protein